MRDSYQGSCWHQLIRSSQTNTGSDFAIEIIPENCALVLRNSERCFTFSHLISEVDEQHMQREGDSITVRMNDDSAYVSFSSTQLGGSLDGVRLFATEPYIVAVRGDRFSYDFDGVKGREKSDPHQNRFIRKTLGIDNDGNLCEYTDRFGEVIVEFNPAI